MRRARLPAILLGLYAAVLAATAWRPYDPFTWFLEVLPALIAIPVLVLTARRWPLTDLLYVLLFVHGTILAVGGHYTYARVPLGFWMEDWFGFTRNHYDRVGHFAQGFIPAMVARELLLRFAGVRRGAWLGILAVCSALAVSALYELLEWGVAEVTGTAAEDFLGTQGDAWDTQKDIAMALLGALAALMAMPRSHDRSLAKLARRPVAHAPAG